MIHSLNNNNNIITVIRKRQLTKPQKSWWVQGPHQDRYYSSYILKKHYIYSFKNPEVAKKCVKFLNEYKFKYNRYPDLSNDNNKISTNNDEDSEIYIDSDIQMSLKYRCSVNNIGLMYIEHFDYKFSKESPYSILGGNNYYNLDISGVDLLEDDIFNNKRQIEHYEYLLDL